MACCQFHDSTIGHNVPSKGISGDPIVAIDTNSIRHGNGVLKELGIAIRYLTDTVNDTKKRIKVAVFTDKNVKQLPFFQTALEALKEEKLDVYIFDNVSVEPTDVSWNEAIKWANDLKADAYISIGGGSVIDTCKAANLYATYPPDKLEFLAYVNKPIGKGLIPPGQLKPHIACPTTAGTGSESTGIAICDILSLNVKTGVAHRLLRPRMAFIDPSVTSTIPPMVAASSAFDVLCHALESYTAIPHYEKQSAAKTVRERFLNRPLSQGSNRWADIGSLQTLQIVGRYLVKARNLENKDDREHMMFASMLAGISFGNAGVHVPHAIAYAIAGNVKGYHAPDYTITKDAHGIIPHGMAVVLTAPSSFKLTASVSPRRHYEGICALRNNNVPRDINPDDGKAVGQLCYDTLVQLMRDTEMPNGLSGVGYSESDIGVLVKGASQQQRLLSNAPMKIENSHLEQICKESMKYW